MDTDKHTLHTRGFKYGERLLYANNYMVSRQPGPGNDPLTFATDRREHKLLNPFLTRGQ